MSEGESTRMKGERLLESCHGLWKRDRDSEQFISKLVCVFNRLEITRNR